MSLNRQKIHISIIMLTALVLIFSAWFYRQAEKNNFSKTFSDNAPKNVIASKETFYNEENYREALSFVQTSTHFSQKNIAAVIVPHHLLASRYAADLLHIAGGRQIDHLVVIGPNHEDLGAQVFSTLTDSSWQTINGQVPTNDFLAQKFLKDFSLLPNQDAFSNEHSLGALMPFVKKYFVKTDVLPIIVNSYANSFEIQRLQNWLQTNLPDNTLIVFSLDFSHYLTKREAEEKDELTIQYIKENNMDRIWQLNNDYVDCPPILVLSLNLAREGNWRSEILYHDNSADLMGKTLAETTSYLGVIFTIDK